MPGTLFVVATPIGNLDDSSPRSIETLRGVDVIACEDTRVTRTLLARHGIATATLSLHAHNERGTAGKLLGALRDGRSVALVSDAGTPGISDPGALLVEQALRAGVRVTPVPGPSAVAAAVSASGFPAGQFFFAGFLPAAPAARRKALLTLDMPCPVVIYEAPHRIAHALEDLLARFGPQREILIARELSKKFEETVRLPLGEAQAWLSGAPHRQHGEFVLVLEPAAPKAASTAFDADAVLGALLDSASLSASEAAKLAARITGLPKNDFYRKALDRQKTRGK